MDKNFNKVVSLTMVQDWLIKHNIDGLLVRATDKYFNEYVPKSISIRYQVSGFDGSMGDVIITQEHGHLFVDGRYALQAKQQAHGFHIHITNPKESIEKLWLDKLNHIIKPHGVLLLDPYTVDMALFNNLSKLTKDNHISLQYNFDDIIQDLKLNKTFHHEAPPFILNNDIAGYDVSYKLNIISNWLRDEKLHGLLLTKLDDIAWLTNIRAYYFPYQSSWPAIALVGFNHIILGVPKDMLTKRISLSAISLIDEDNFPQAIKKAIGNNLLGIDIKELAKAHELSLQKHNIALKSIINPVTTLKAKKNEKELLHLRSSFKKADQAVYKTCTYIEECFSKNIPLSELDVETYLKEAFKNTKAETLSFRPICASKENGAIIHYGHPQSDKILTPNSLFLLDTGAYYQGYATDLTRTFLVGNNNATAKDWQKHMFTLVLKASIAGLSARLKKGVIGIQLDAIVRAPIWRAGFDYAHGTGHGIGINVHEFPPRISLASNTELTQGQVFSIEPGIYIENLGGVRIENLATLVIDPSNDNFLRVLPLTFCPLDERLIDHDLLDSYEEEFLVYFKEEWLNDSPWPNLPPLRSFSL